MMQWTHRSENENAVAPRHAKIGDLTALAVIGSINTQKSRENDARRVAVRALTFSPPLFE